MPPTPTIALGLTRRLLGAAMGSIEDGSLRVDRVFQDEVPPSLAIDDASALGAWVGERLRSEGFPRARTTVALARSQVGLKRLTLPTVDPVELPEMTRLAMQRDLPFDASEAVIDFVPVDRTETQTTVIVAAVPRDVLEFNQAMIKAAGLPGGRISIRVMGVAALLSTLPDGDGRSLLAIDVADGSVEFCAVVDGAVRFSRAAEATAEDSGDRVAAILTETRRTWMSYRIVEYAEDVDRVILIGPAPVARDAAGPIGDTLNVPARVLEYHPLVQDGGAELAAAWPLAGLLLEPVIGETSIDFAHPRQAPDVSARSRQLTLAAVGLIAVVLLASFVIGTVKQRRLEDRAAALAGQVKLTTPQRLRYKRDQLKLEHLRRWRSAGVDWLGHMDTLAALAPRTDQVVLGPWSGVLEFRGVRWDRKEGWSAPRTVKLNVEGEAVDRATADAFRAALVRTELYRTSSSGADAAGGRRLPCSFTFTLRSDQGAPPSDPAPPAPVVEPPAGSDS